MELIPNENDFFTGVPDLSGMRQGKQLRYPKVFRQQIALMKL